MFGLTIIKTKKLHDLESEVDSLVDHIMENAGFVDEKGVLGNSKPFYDNPARIKHWRTFHTLTRSISQMFRKL